MRLLTITNQKGGSGKTTTAVNLAAALGEQGQKVLVIDLDPQASASAWLGVKDGGKGLLQIFTDHGKLDALVTSTPAPGVELIPASSWLIGVEKALAGEVGAEIIFRRHLDPLLAGGRWNYVLMDCPPSLGLLALSALVAAREVLIPVEAHVMALSGLAALHQTITRVKERLNPEVHVSMILPCRVDPRTNLSKDVVARLRERFGKTVLQTVIRENVRLAEAPSFGKPITQYAPTSAGAQDYRAAATEILKRRVTP